MAVRCFLTTHYSLLTTHYSLLTTRHSLLQPRDERALARENLLPRFFRRKPSGAIDLGESRLAAALGRPLDLECVRSDRGRIEIAFDRPGGNDLAALLD